MPEEIKKETSLYVSETLCNARNINRILSTEHAWLNTQALRSRALRGRQGCRGIECQEHLLCRTQIDTIDFTSGSERVGRRKDEEE